MVKICEHKFEAEDLKHEGYSLTEVDLFPAVGDQGEAYSMRRNLDGDFYEIFDFEHEEPYSDAAVAYSGSLETMIELANQLERDATGSGSFEYGHSPYLHDGCPDEILYEGSL